jgi:hypothetical protein
MTQTANAKGIAGPIILMFLAVATAAWFAYSTLFPQDVITFLVTIIYFPIIGIIAVGLYRHLRHKA